MDLDDAVLPAAPYLLGGGARDLLSVAIGNAGGRLHRCTSVQALYRPGHDLVVRYDTTVDWGDGRALTETLVACTTAAGAPPGTMVLQAGDLEVAVWRYPFDPDLPGLAVAVTPSGVAELLGGHVGDGVTLNVRTFRPRRRAVVEATGSTGRVFLKVVAPQAVARVVDAHRALAGLGVPEVVAAHPSEGIVVLAALEGETLHNALGAGTGPWPAEPVLDLLAGLRDTEWPGAPRAEPGPMVHAAGHAALIERVLPAERDRLRRLVDLVGTPADTTPTGIVHGDLHGAQILVGPGGAVSGVLDLDDAGAGQPADDVANLVAHLRSFALGRAAPARRRAESLAAALCRDHGTGVDPADLDRRIAASLVAMATSPFRTRQAGWRRMTSARLAAAEAYLRPHEKTLRAAS